MRLFSLFFLSVFFAGSAYGQTMDVTGSLPRDLSDGEFTITVVVNRVSNERKLAGDADTSTASRFEVKIGNNSQEILFENEEGYQDEEKSRYHIVVEEQNPPEPDPNFSTQWQYRYVLRIIDNSGNGTYLKEDAPNRKLSMDIRFSLAGTEVAKVEDKIIEQELYVITERPTFQSPLAGVYEGLVVDYKEKNSVTTTKGSRPATTLNLIVVDTKIVTGDTTLLAKRFSGDETDDTKEECEYVAAERNGGSCVSCPSGQVYLDTAAIAKLSGFKVVSANAKAKSATIRGLENRAEGDPEYVVFAQYPSGVAQSVCLTGIPKRDVSMTELNGAGSAKNLDIRCFIATAAYGSPWHGSVNLFRAFRDRVLLQFDLGKWFVETYYGHSPVAAEAIEDNEFLKAAVRATLAIPAAILDIFYDDDEIEYYPQAAG